MQISDDESKKSISSLAETVESGEFLSFSSDWNLGSDKYGFDNSHMHKPHGKLALDITMLLNSKVSEDTKTRSSRHANLKTHTCYQRHTNENINQKYKVMNLLLCTSSDSYKSH